MKKITLLTLLLVLPFLTFAQGPWEFNTDGDTEGWSKSQASALTVGGGQLTFTPTGGNPKLIQAAANVDAGTNKFIHITLTNGTVNERLRVSFPKTGGGRAYRNVAITPSTTTSMNYDIDLTNGNWSGTVNDIQIHIKLDAVNTNATPGGNILIDKIVIDNNATLSTTNFTISEFSVSPNPATNVINIKGNTQISNVSVYDITGKRVISTSSLVNNALNISALNAGVYILNIVDSKNNSTTKKIVKK